MSNGCIKTEHGGNAFIQYSEEMQVAKSYKQNYLHGIEHIINQRQREAEESRASYTQNIFDASADYREALKKMLGWPLVGHTSSSIDREFNIPFGSTLELIAEVVDGNSLRYRAVLEYWAVNEKGEPVDDDFLGLRDLFE